MKSVAIASFVLCVVVVTAGVEFACSGTRNCTCTEFTGYYELICPRGSVNHDLAAKIVPGSYVEVNCLLSAEPSAFEDLLGLRVGPVSDVFFQYCPLPAIPIAELLSALDATAVTTLQFRSHRNLRAAFDGTHLRELGNLTKLLLLGNNLTELPEDFLVGVPKLTWLSLKENAIARLPERFFAPVPDLERLDLIQNGLATLPLLSNLVNLKILNVWKNELRNVTRSDFSALRRLSLLDLSNNAIESLPRDAFRDLEGLAKLSISSNRIESLPDGLLAGTARLELFHLHDNRRALALGDAVFANLPRLREVYLMRNGIAFLPESSFRNSPAVTNISLRGNALTRIPALLFRDQINLQVLDVSENLIEHLPDNVFARLANLRALNLSRNKLKRIARRSLYGANRLELLDAEENELHFVDSESLKHLQQLKTVRFAHNKLSFLPEEEEEGGRASGEELAYRDHFGTSSPFGNCLSLEDLSLANNSISEIFQDWRILHTKLRFLNLSYNQIKSLTTWDIHFQAGNVVVDLRRNRISIVDLEAVESLAMSQEEPSPMVPKRNVRILLDENPLDCDCHAYQVLRYVERRLHPSVYELATLVTGDLECAAPPRYRGTKIAELSSRQFTCNLNPTYACPHNCTCAYKRIDSGLVVNCTSRGLAKIPDALPAVDCANHTELLLDGNRIESLPNRTYPGYEAVTHLSLSSNRIASIDTGMLSRNIEVLRLDDNALSTLSPRLARFLSQSRRLRLLTLHNNPWQCDCSARELLDLIQQKFKEIQYLANITCSNSNRPLSNLPVSDLCPISMAVLVSCIVAAVFGILIGSLAAFYYRYQREVKVWLYSHRLCLWFVTEEELDRDKLYDAFVSYSHKDESFVVGTLVPELESGDNPFKLCLHYRDWIAGEWIPNQIARSVENSRRTLVVLSPNFLESVWSRMEFRAAHKQALSEGRARVIVVLYGDVGPTEDLDPELRAYISMNTYVKWGDPWFWGKLKYALPHPPSLVRSNNLGFIRRRSMKKKTETHVDDKLELIHKLEPLTSPAGDATTTPPPLDGIPNGNAKYNKELAHLA